MDAYDPYVLTFGQTLRKLREAADLSQERLATRLGHATPATVASWEAGRRRPRYSTLRALSSALNVPLAALTGVSDLPRDAYGEGDSPAVADAIAVLRGADRTLQAALVRMIQALAREYATARPSAPHTAPTRETPGSTAPSTGGTPRPPGKRTLRRGR